MDRIDRPDCTAQYTDHTDTWGCTGHHLGAYHVAVDDTGAVTRMWIDRDQPDTDRYGPLLDAVERLVARLRGRATDPDVRAVVAAYDQLDERAGVVA